MNFLFCGLTSECLFLFSFLFVTRTNAEISELVRVLARCHHPKIISELLLLQVTLRQVFELSLAELEVRRGSDGKLGPVTGDDYVVGGKGPGLSLWANLDAIMEVLLERGNIKYLVINRGRAVNYELDGLLLAGLTLQISWMQATGGC